MRLELFIDKARAEKMIWAMGQATSPQGLSMFLLDEYKQWIEGRTTRRFLMEGDDASGKWVPLAESTIRYWRPRVGVYGGPINIREGQMFDWATESDASVRMNTASVTMRYPRNIPRGKLRPKVETAQHGRKFPRTPRRPIFAVNQVDAEAFLTMFSNWLEDYLRDPVQLTEVVSS